MPYMSCPRCRFVVRLRETDVAWGCCPVVSRAGGSPVAMQTTDRRVVWIPRGAAPVTTAAAASVETHDG